MAKKEWTPPSLADFGYVGVEEAARQLGVCLNTVYEYIMLPRGDWHLVNGRWRINLESLRRRRAQDQEWRERVRATHVAIAPELRAPLDVRPEPDWASLPEFLDAKTADRLLGHAPGEVAKLGRNGRLPRTKKSHGLPPGASRDGVLPNYRTRWWYRTEDVRGLWLEQQALARRRALKGESFGFWGPRDHPEPASGKLREMVDSKTAAEILGVSVYRVSQLCRTGKLPAYQRRPGKPGSKLSIPRWAAERLAQRPEFVYHQELYRLNRRLADEPEPMIDEHTGKVLTPAARMRIDGERREAAKTARRELMLEYGLEGERAYELREHEWAPEDGTQTEIGYGYRQWVPPNRPPTEVECRPHRREFGECEIDHGDFYSTSQVARLLGVHRSAVATLRVSGVLQGFQRKKHTPERGPGSWWWFYRKQEVEELVARRQRDRRDKARRRLKADEEGEGPKSQV